MSFRSKGLKRTRHDLLRFSELIAKIVRAVSDQALTVLQPDREESCWESLQLGIQSLIIMLFTRRMGFSKGEEAIVSSE